MSGKKKLLAVVLTAIILGSLTPVLVFVFTRDERYPKRALIFQANLFPRDDLPPRGYIDGPAWKAALEAKNG